MTLCLQGAWERPCNCDSTGSISALCDKYYGGCECKTLVMGRKVRQMMMIVMIVIMMMLLVRHLRPRCFRVPKLGLPAMRLPPSGQPERVL